MAEWARYKGIQVLATGDFTHPFWFEKLKVELVEAGNGLFKLKSPVASDQRPESNIYFLLSCEISSIYSEGGKGRRIHNLFFFPSLSSVEKFNQELVKRGANLRSDGRPIVGMSSRDLAEIALSVDEKALVIPAHAWTPWFSLYGSFSGFDSVEECFGDMAEYIYGIETGLSSDPAMNWQIGDLDNRSILSFSDAHSLEKMGREATVFEADEISYESIYRAVARNPSNHPTIQPSNHPKIAFTIEFYPEEGKYHFTGHRDCGVSFSPEETKEKGEICPVCGRGLTVGVMHRVGDLKTRDQSPETRDPSTELRTSQNGVRWVHQQGNGRPPYVNLVPLYEIIAEAMESTTFSKKVTECYLGLVNNLGSEFNILLKADVTEIGKFAPARVAEGIEKVRSGNIIVEPGYDGKFGVVKIWPSTREDVAKDIQEPSEEEQLNLFA